MILVYGQNGHIQNYQTEPIVSNELQVREKAKQTIIDRPRGKIFKFNNTENNRKRYVTAECLTQSSTKCYSVICGIRY